ncbi:MAG: phosphoenolpyruvate-utilizing N-terminal domain-containing protein, partial [Calditrichia bacterium]
MNSSEIVSSRAEIAIKGIAASPGIAVGPVYIYHEPAIAPERRTISRKRIEPEILRFRKAIETSKKHLKRIHSETLKNYGEEFAEIVETQIAILEDHLFLKEVEQLIAEKNYDAAYATFKIFQNKREHFLNLSSEYFKDRAVDILNLKRLVLKKMLGKKLDVQIKEQSIIAADSLSPADTLRLHHKHIMGFCTNVGGKNSHTAIVARSLGVPAVLGTEYITNMVNAGDELILDGNEGVIVVNPGPETIAEYQIKKKDFLLVEKGLLEKAPGPAVTLDGTHITVNANIEFMEELEQVL